MIGPDGQLKIIDLGISCIKGTCLNNSFTPAYTMLKYMVASPQVKNNLAFNNDIYSSLILIYFLASNGSTKFTSSGEFLQNTNAEYNKIPEKYRKFLMDQIGLILSVASPPLDAEGSIKKMQEILAGLNAIETSGGRTRFRKTKRRSKGSRTRRLLKHRF
jgi:hypothetical protein